MLRNCPACGAQNRVPARHLADTGRCGACKAALPPIATPLDVDTATFEEIAREAKVPVLVDFWAEWCAPCRRAAPEVAAAAAQLGGKAIVLKVNTEKHPALARKYGVTGIPSFLVLQDGHPVRRQTGLMDARGLTGLVPR